MDRVLTEVTCTDVKGDDCLWGIICKMKHVKYMGSGNCSFTPYCSDQVEICPLPVKGVLG